MSETINLKEHLKHPTFALIGSISDTEGLETYVIGGFVRDLLLYRKRDHYDIDIVTVGSGIALAKKVAFSHSSQIEGDRFQKFRYRHVPQRGGRL